MLCQKSSSYFLAAGKMFLHRCGSSQTAKQCCCGPRKREALLCRRRRFGGEAAEADAEHPDYWLNCISFGAPVTGFKLLPFVQPLPVCLALWPAVLLSFSRLSGLEDDPEGKSATFALAPAAAPSVPESPGSVACPAALPDKRCRALDTGDKIREYWSGTLELGEGK